jgi:hypothetical protein
MKQIECPYCGTDNYDSEFYEDPSEIDIEKECVNCGKHFLWSYTMEAIFNVTQADCLNDGNHQWKQQIRYPKTEIHIICKICGKIKEDRAIWKQLEKSKKETNQ